MCKTSEKPSYQLVTCFTLHWYVIRVYEHCFDKNFHKEKEKKIVYSLFFDKKYINFVFW